MSNAITNFFNNAKKVVTGAAVVGSMVVASSCDDPGKGTGPEGPGTGPVKPVETYTYEQISTNINGLSADANAKTVTITNVPDETGVSRSITYKLSEDNTASNRVKLLFANADFSQISPSSTGAYVGTFSTPDDVQVLVKSVGSNITASAKDGTANAKVINDKKTYSKMSFRNFSSEEATKEFTKQLKDTTNTSWVPLKSDFKYAGKDWAIK